MQRHSFVPGPDQVLDDMRSGRVSSPVAKPLARFHTLHNAGLIRDAAISAGVFWKLDLHVAVIVAIVSVLSGGNESESCCLFLFAKAGILTSMWLLPPLERWSPSKLELIATKSTKIDA
jgi:hypothetical protein